MYRRLYILGIISSVLYVLFSYIYAGVYWEVDRSVRRLIADPFSSIPFLFLLLVLHYGVLSFYFYKKKERFSLAATVLYALSILFGLIGLTYFRSDPGWRDYMLMSGLIQIAMAALYGSALAFSKTRKRNALRIYGWLMILMHAIIAYIIYMIVILELRYSWSEDLVEIIFNLSHLFPALLILNFVLELRAFRPKPEDDEILDI